MKSLDWESLIPDDEVFHPNLNFPVSTDPIIPEVQNNTVTIRWTGQIRIELEGDYKFNMLSAGNMRLMIGEEWIIDSAEYPPAKWIGGVHSQDVVMELKRGLHEIAVEYQPLWENDMAGI